MSAFRTPSNAMADCIQNCTACEHLCLEASDWCRSQGGEYAKPEFLALLALCADICGASARAMQGGSDAYVFLCEACARVCRRCLEEFARLSPDERLRPCAAACANCARCCADIARTPETEPGAGARKAS